MYGRGVSRMEIKPLRRREKCVLIILKARSYNQKSGTRESIYLNITVYPSGCW